MKTFKFKKISAVLLSLVLLLSLLPVAAFAVGPTYSLTYMADTGGGSTTYIATKTIPIAAYTAVTTSEPEHDEGWPFLGWDEDEFAETASYQKNDKIYVNDVIVLYAIWDKETAPEPEYEYSLSYDGNGGTAPSARVFAAPTAATVSPLTPIHPLSGFRFWVDLGSDGFDEYLQGASIYVDRNIVLTAIWDDTEVTVTFVDAMGGSPVAYPINVSYGFSVDAPTEPELDSHHFLGWFTKDGTGGDWGDEWEFTDPVKEDRTLYAKWGINTYQVIFDYDNEEGLTPALVKDDIWLEHGFMIPSTWVPAAPNELKTGYNFQYWYYVDSVLGNVQWYLDDAVTPTEVTGPVTLIAKWTLTPCTVTFVYDNDMDPPDDGDVDSTYEYGDEVTCVPILSLWKEGCSFDYWYSLDELDNEVKWNTGDTLEGDITLYAKWKINTYQVIFNYDNAEGPTPALVKDDIWLEHFFYIPATWVPAASNELKYGYAFQYWYYLDPPPTEVPWDHVLYFVHEDVTLYAKWEKTAWYAFLLEYENLWDITTATVIVDDLDDIQDALDAYYDLETEDQEHPDAVAFKEHLEALIAELDEQEAADFEATAWLSANRQYLNNEYGLNNLPVMYFLDFLYDVYNTYGALSPRAKAIVDDYFSGQGTGYSSTNVYLWDIYLAILNQMQALNWLLTYGDLLDVDPAAPITMQTYTRASIKEGIRSYYNDLSPASVSYIESRYSVLDFTTVEDLFNDIYFNWFKVKIGAYWDDLPENYASPIQIFSFATITALNRSTCGTVRFYNVTTPFSEVTGSLSTSAAGTKYDAIVTYANGETEEFQVSITTTNIKLTATYDETGDPYLANTMTNKLIQIRVDIINGPVVEEIRWGYSTSSTTPTTFPESVTPETDLEGNQYYVFVIGDGTVDYDEETIKGYMHFRTFNSPSSNGAAINIRVNYDVTEPVWSNKTNIQNGAGLALGYPYYPANVTLSFDRSVKVYYLLNGAAGDTSYGTNVTLSSNGTYELLYADDQYGNRFTFSDGTDPFHYAPLIIIAKALPTTSALIARYPDEVTNYTAGTGTTQPITIRMDLTGGYATKAYWQFVPQNQTGDTNTNLNLLADWAEIDIQEDEVTHKQYVILTVGGAASDLALDLASDFDDFINFWASTISSTANNEYVFDVEQFDGAFRFKAENSFGTASSIRSIRVVYNSFTNLQWLNPDIILKGLGRVPLDPMDDQEDEFVTDRYPSYQNVSLEFNEKVKVQYYFNGSATLTTTPSGSTFSYEVNLTAKGTYQLFRAYDQWNNEVDLRDVPEFTIDGGTMNLVSGPTADFVYDVEPYDSTGVPYPSSTGSGNRTNNPYKITAKITSSGTYADPYLVQYQFVPYGGTLSTLDSDWITIEDIQGTAPDYYVELLVNGKYNFYGTFYFRAISTSGKLSSNRSFGSNYNASVIEFASPNDGTFNDENPNGIEFDVYSTARSMIFDRVIVEYGYHFWPIDDLEGDGISYNGVANGSSGSATINFATNGRYMIFWVKDQYGNTRTFDEPRPEFVVDNRTPWSMQNFHASNTAYSNVINTVSEALVSPVETLTPAGNYAVGHITPIDYDVTIVLRKVSSAPISYTDNVSFQYSYDGITWITIPGLGNELPIAYTGQGDVKIWFRTIHAESGKQSTSEKSLIIHFDVL